MLFDIYEQLMITKTLVSLITGPKMYCSVTQTQSLYRGFPYIRFPYIRTLIHYSLIGAFGASKFGALSRGSLITEVCISGSNCNKLKECSLLGEFNFDPKGNSSVSHSTIGAQLC